MSFDAASASVMEAMSNGRLPPFAPCKIRKHVRKTNARECRHSRGNGVTVSERLNGGEMWDDGRKCSVTVWSDRGEECEHIRENT